MIVGQLHHEGYRGAREGLGLLEHDGRDDDSDDAHEVEQGSHPPGTVVGAHEHAHHKRDDRQLGRAGNQGGEHGRHAAIALVLDGLSREHAGHATAR